MAPTSPSPSKPSTPPVADARAPALPSQNLRRQAEVLSKQERLFAPRPANWLSWEDANRARVKAVEKLNACTDGAQRPKLIRDCLVLAFHTLQPVRRLECARCRLHALPRSHAHTCLRSCSPPRSAA